MTDVRLYACCITPEIPAMLLILGVGLYLTVRLGVPQLVLLPRALRLFFRRLVSPEKKEGVSSFQALCTALAATVGTGNLVGVAGAICLGGPGAIFWMWVCGFLGMATKFSETALAVRYRVKTPAGFSGRPYVRHDPRLRGKIPSHGKALLPVWYSRRLRGGQRRPDQCGNDRGQRAADPPWR